MSAFGKLLRGVGVGLGRGRASKKLRGVATPKASLKSTYGAKTPRTPKDTSKQVEMVQRVKVDYHPDLIPLIKMTIPKPGWGGGSTLAEIGQAARGRSMNTRRQQLVITEMQMRGMPPLDDLEWEAFAGAIHNQAGNLRKFAKEARSLGANNIISSHGPPFMMPHAFGHTLPTVGDTYRTLVRHLGKEDSMKWEGLFNNFNEIVSKAVSKEGRSNNRPFNSKTPLGMGGTHYYRDSKGVTQTMVDTGTLGGVDYSAMGGDAFQESMEKMGLPPLTVTLSASGKPFIGTVPYTTKPLRMSERLRSFKRQKTKTRLKKAAKVGGAAALTYGAYRGSRDR